jgi:hypothetical protein
MQQLYVHLCSPTTATAPRHRSCPPPGGITSASCVSSLAANSLKVLRAPLTSMCPRDSSSCKACSARPTRRRPLSAVVVLTVLTVLLLLLLMSLLLLSAAPCPEEEGPAPAAAAAESATFAPPLLSGKLEKEEDDDDHAASRLAPPPPPPPQPLLPGTESRPRHRRTDISSRDTPRRWGKQGAFENGHPSRAYPSKNKNNRKSLKK